jgi:hypothetical protein
MSKSKKKPAAVAPAIPKHVPDPESACLEAANKLSVVLTLVRDIEEQADQLDGDYTGWHCVAAIDFLEQIQTLLRASVDAAEAERAKAGQS